MSGGGDRDALITGIGLVTAHGVGREAHSNAIEAGPGAPSKLASFDGTTMPVQAAFQVSKVRPQPFMLRRKDLKLMSRDSRLALQAAGLALTDAGLMPMDPSSWPVAPEDVGLFMGVGLEPGDIVELGPVVADACKGSNIDLQRLGAESINLIPPLSALKTLPNMALAHVSINLGLMGPGEALSPWGTSGIAALGVAVEAIERGECDMALVGATDSDIDLGGVSTHARLGTLARLESGEAVSGEMDGLVLGEGASFVVLEARGQVERRGASSLGRVAAVNTGCIGAHRVPDYRPEGLAAILRPMLGPVGEGRALMTSTAGHCGAWRRMEAAMLSGLPVDLVPISDRIGWCTAAAGLADLGVLMASADPDARWIAGAAWGPSGEWAAALIDREDGQ